ncbi:MULTISPECIES: hypothetical protein [Bradyrhizobium]|uniref:hypothetical protein n=1 Tax=Bradyrhizobium TaxID=374 RepID=UPI001FE7237C|nr:MULTISPECIES: hypothetical protein [Bradyrhizobium]MCS3764792.1 ABC-type nitrate/sulfonate/bicarbonate transport system permease component [Bradyrhizobium centrosematis]
MFILLLGVGELSKITMVIYSCAWPLLLNTIAAVKPVDPLLIKRRGRWARRRRNCSAR